MCVGVLIRRVTSLSDSAPACRITDGLHLANGLMGRLCLRRSRTARRSTFINKKSALIAMTVLGVLRATGFAHAHAHAQVAGPTTSTNLGISESRHVAMGWSVPRATKEMIKALPDFDYDYDTTQRDKFVDLDFVEEAEKMLLPGKVALVAEVDEEWVVSVDASLEASGGTLFRRARSEVIDTQFDHAIGACKGEIKELEAEAAHATGEAKSKLQVQIVTAKAGLARAVQHAKQRVEALRQDAPRRRWRSRSSSITRKAKSRAHSKSGSNV